MTRRWLVAGVLAAGVGACGGESTATPPSQIAQPQAPTPAPAPFFGSIYLDPGIITPADATTFRSRPRDRG